MKNLITNSAFYLLLVLLFTLVTTLDVKSQIVSAPGGGLWSSGTTWVGGIVPGAANNVVISSTVSANGNACNNISISSGGVLMNFSNNTYSLNVNGNLTNNGTISNNVSYSFNLIVFGNVTNNGIMSNNALTLGGSGNQQLASTQPMTISNFNKNATSGRAIATTALNFVGTNINLSADTLEFTTGNSITMNGGYLSSGVLYKSALPALQITSGNGTYSYFMTIDATQLVLNGTLLIYATNNYKNNVINSGILQNYPNNAYTLTVTGNFTNNGTVQNNVYNFTMNVSGNLANNGTWTNYSTVLNGSANQGLSMTQPFSGANLTRYAATGRVRATSGLSFIGTAITLNNDTLEFTTGNSVSMNGGYFSSGVLYKSSLPALQITAGNDTYVYFMTIDALQSELNGTLLIYSTNIFKGSVSNFGTLQNFQNNAYTLTVTGNFTNNGIVKNNVYNFTMNVSGNLTNNGTWTNYSTVLNGSANQGLAMTQPFGGAFLTRIAATGRVRATTGISFVGTAIEFNADTLEFTTGNSITMNGGYLSTGVLYKSSLPAVQINASNGTYVYFMTIDALQSELNGTLAIYSTNNFKNNVFNSGTLQNFQNNAYTLTVTGSFTNNGIVKNNVYNFTMNVTGNLTNNGAWTNYSTVLNGSANQGLAMTQPFGGAYLTKTVSAGRAIATTGISFVGTAIEFSADTLAFTTGNALTMSGGYLNACVLYKTSLPAIQITSGSGNYLSGVTIDSPQAGLNGTVLISGSTNNFKTNITNSGILQNRSNNQYTLTVNGNFTNVGNIQNNVYYFFLDISGNVTNDGAWKNYSTTLIGTNNRSIAFIKRFEGVNFTKSVAAGNLTATTDLIFDGVAVDLNGTLLTLANNGYLSILNGYFGDAVIAGNNIHFNTLAGYCFSTQFSTDVSLHGVFQAAGGISFNGSVINQGNLRSYSNNNYSFTVSGDLQNNGSISNGVYNLTLTILGDITNNGTWTNYQTTLDGVANQNIYLNSTIDGRLLLDANNTGAGNWFGPSGTLVGNSNFSGVTGQVLTFLNPVTNLYQGQYYRTGTGGNSRSIYINTPANPARLLTMNFLLEGLYLSNGVMRASLDGGANPVFGANIADQVSIELHDNINFSNVLFVREGALLGTNGTVSFNVPGNYSGSYYLAIRHRSGIVTVSSTPVSFNTPTVNYSFNQLSRAYGNNLAQTSDGHFALYGGDVNQDGNVDIADMTPVDNESTEFAVGYRNPDTNGDGIIDISDMTIIDNNSSSFISARYP